MRNFRPFNLKLMKLKRRGCPVNAEWEPHAKIPRKTLTEPDGQCEMNGHNKRKREDYHPGEMVMDATVFTVKRKRQRCQMISEMTGTLENKNLQTVCDNSFLFWGTKEAKLQARNNKMDVDLDNNVCAPEHPEYSCFTYWKSPFPEMSLTDIG